MRYFLKNLTISIILLLSACSSHTYKSVYSEVRVPRWQKSIPQLNKAIIMPFNGVKYHGESFSLAKNIEKNFISTIKESEQFTLYTEKNLRDYSLSDSSFTIDDIESVIKAGEKLNADIVILGHVSEYEKYEDYIGFVERREFTADEYQKRVSCTFTLEVYSVASKELLLREERPFSAKDFGHKNVHRIPVSKQEKLDNSGYSLFLGTMDLLLGDPRKLESYKELKERCVSSIMSTYTLKILKYQYVTKNTYTKEPNGKLTLVQSDKIGQTIKIKENKKEVLAKVE